MGRQVLYHLQEDQGDTLHPCYALPCWPVLVTAWRASAFQPARTGQIQWSIDEDVLQVCLHVHVCSIYECIPLINQGNQHEIKRGIDTADAEEQSPWVFRRQWTEGSFTGCQIWQMWWWWALPFDLFQRMQNVQIHTLLWTSGLVQCLCLCKECQCLICIAHYYHSYCVFYYIS